MNAHVLMVATCLTISASVGCSEKNEMTEKYDCGAVVGAVVELHRNANDIWRKHRFGKENTEGDATQFDVQEYFTVLKHVSPPKGYVLDYVHGIYSIGDGRPLLYLRKERDPRLKAAAEYWESFPDSGPNAVYAWPPVGLSSRCWSEVVLPSRLRVDGTPESFFELVVFEALAGQFYLVWHDNYNDTQVVTSQRDVEQVISSLEKGDFGTPLTSEQKEKARQIDATPRVSYVGKETAAVSIVMFSKWGGFTRVTRHVSRRSPHKCRKMHTETLVKYFCGVVF